MLYEEAEIVHIEKSVYDAEVAMAKEVVRRQELSPEKDAKTRKSDEVDVSLSRCPTREELEGHDVVHNVRKYLPYLLYCREAYAKEEGKEEIAGYEYVCEILDELVYVVEDADVKRINSTTAVAWGKASLEQRCEIFAPLVAYYGWNEFNTFVRDLGYRKFMAAYGQTQKKADEGEPCESLVNDLAEVWKKLQGL